MPPWPSRTLVLRLLSSPFSSATKPYSSSAPAAASVWSFGDNSSGALGCPLLDAYEPTKVPSLPGRITGVAAGHYHSLAVTAEGEVWAWGRNEEGQLGRGLSSPRDTWNKPERVMGLQNVRAAYASGVVSAAIDHDGSLWVWGRSKRGQLGLGKGVTEAINPSKVEALSGHKILKVSFGWGHGLAQTKDGKLFGWGYSENGRLGQMGRPLDTPFKPPCFSDGSDKSTMLEIVEKLVAEKLEKENNMPVIWEPTFVQEIGSLRVSDVACGLDHSLVACCDSTILSCGDNTYGQLGRRTEGSEMLPVNMNCQPLSLSAGLGHCLVVCRSPSQVVGETENKVLSWGWNRSSQLGRQGPEDSPGMVEGPEGENPVAVSAGRVHSVALTSKGELWTWGSGRNGRLGLGSSVDEMEPALVESLIGLEVLQVASGFDHNLLLVTE